MSSLSACLYEILVWRQSLLILTNFIVFGQSSSADIFLSFWLTILPSKAFPEVVLQGKVSLDVNLMGCFLSTFGNISGKMLNLLSVCLIDGKFDCGQGGVDFPTSVLWIICSSEKREKSSKSWQPRQLSSYAEILPKYREKKREIICLTPLGHFVMLNLCVLFVLVAVNGTFLGVKLFWLQFCQVSCAFLQSTCFSSNGNGIWIRQTAPEISYHFCVLEILEHAHFCSF